MKASKLALALVLTASVLSAETRPFNDFAYSAALRIQNRQDWRLVMEIGDRQIVSRVSAERGGAS